MIERVTQAVQYYWELAYAWQNLDVQKEAVRLAVAKDRKDKLPNLPWIPESQPSNFR